MWSLSVVKNTGLVGTNIGPIGTDKEYLGLGTNMSLCGPMWVLLMTNTGLGPPHDIKMSSKSSDDVLFVIYNLQYFNYFLKTFVCFFMTS